MRYLFLISCLVVGTLAQPDWFGHLQEYINGVDDSIDFLHNMRIEYHHADGTRHLMIGIKDGPGPRECHFVEVSPVWEPLLQDPTKVPLMTEEVYHLITDPNYPESVLTEAQLNAAYGDPEASTECAGHKIYVLNYTPSAAVQNA